MPGPPQIPDYNPYQGATYGEMASYLSAKSGLDYNVALNWLRAEGSRQRGNPLGVNYSAAAGPRLYPSWQAGLDAAISLIQSKYAGIVAAIASRSPAAERQAIIASPWAPGHYQGQNGTSSFSMVGVSASPGTSSWDRVLASLGISTDPAHKFSQAEAAKLASAPAPIGYGIAAGSSVANDIIRTLTGTTVGDWRGKGASGQTTNTSDPVAAVGQAAGDLFGSMFAWVPGFAVNAGILVLIGVLGWKGMRAVLELD